MIKNSLKYYSFFVTSMMTLGGFLTATTPAQLITAIFFYPLAVYFLFEIIPQRKQAIKLPKIEEIKKTTKAPATKPLKNIRNSDDELEELVELAVEGDVVEKSEGLDIDRRAFIKLIGSAGLSVFMLSLVTKRAQAAFFGSVPGPGTVALKDSSGNQIDPAEKQPTDGYRLGQLDDSSPSYYGFTNKDGAWFIIQENSSGNFRYVSGSSGFSTNWTNRASLSYDYYENVF